MDSLSDYSKTRERKVYKIFQEFIVRIVFGKFDYHNSVAIYPKFKGKLIISGNYNGLDCTKNGSLKRITWK